MPLSLQEIKNQRLVWSASNAAQRTAVASQYLSSGFPVFDQQVGGWPASGLVELQPSAMGIGELRLILPALSLLTESQNSDSLNPSTKKLQVWLPSGAQLMPHGLGSALASQTLVMKALPHTDALWVLDTLLQSGVCGSVVCWLSGLEPAQAKRLQLAAKEHGTLVFCIQSNVRQQNSLPISMRLRLEPTKNGLSLDVFKRQNAYSVEPFYLDFASVAPSLYQRTRISEAHAYQHNVLTFPKSRHPSYTG